MGLFSRKKSESTNTNNGGSDGDMIGDLVSYFQSKDCVEEAYFGRLRNEETGSYHLFLAIKHEGELASIQQMTYMIKQTHNPNLQLNFTSSEERPDLLSFVEQTNFPFYKKGETLALNEQIMRTWFDQGASSLVLWNTLSNSRPNTLVQTEGIEQNKFLFQTYVRDGREFIPVFSDTEMIKKSGMVELPEGLSAIEFDWNKVFGANLNDQYIIINPGTPFEFEFK